MESIARTLYQRVTSFGLAFMLAVSSLAVVGPFIASQSAYAVPAGGVKQVYTSLSGSGWSFYNDEGSSPAIRGIAIDPEYTAGATNNGAVRINATAGQKHNLSSANFNGTKLADITSLGYSTYIVNAGSSYINIDVDFGDNSFKKYNGRLVYTPEATVNSWTESANAVESGSWSWSQYSSNGSKWVDGATAKHRTWGDIVAAFPNAKIATVNYFLGFKLSTTGYFHLRADQKDVYFDNIYLQKNNASYTIYDFELPPLSAPANLRSAELSCGEATNINSITPTWDAVAGATSYNYRAVFPDSTVFGPGDVGNVTSVNGPFGLGAEGTYTFSVQAVAANGLTSGWSEPCAATYDKTAPKVNYINRSGSDQLTNSDSLRFLIQFSEEITGEDVSDFSLDTTGTVSGEIASISKDMSYPYSNRYYVNVVNVVGDGTLRLVLNSDATVEDRAGNIIASGYFIGQWYIVDNKKPSLTASLDDTVIERGDSNPELTVTAYDTASDIDYVQYKIVDPSGDTVVGWKDVTDHAQPEVVDVSSLVDGDYSIQVRAFDRAGNRSSGVVAVDFTVSKKAVIGDYFVADANGLNVGFTVDRFTDAESVTVSLYDEGGNPIVGNFGDSSDILALINTGSESSISSPFYIPVTLLNDGYWQFGNIDWRSANKPAYAIVTITRTGGEPVESGQIQLSGSTEEGDYTYEAHIAALPTLPDVDDNNDGDGDENGNTDDEESNNNSEDDTDTGSPEDEDANSEDGAGDNTDDLTPPDEFIEDQDGEVNGAQDDNTDDQDVAAAQDDNTNGDENENNNTLLGLAWYWWLAILAAAAALWWLIAGALRRRNNEEA